ncbi:leucine-rich repeat-containing protein [Sesbania bispinosa]|nr:leucine-rich repeat-containing protein [Sesbania bispinosa]
MSGCDGEARDKPDGGSGEERAHDDGLRNHNDAARGERHLARWRWYGWWQHRSGCGEEEDEPVCVTATTWLVRMNQVDHECYHPTGRVMACIFWFGHAI